MSALLKSPLLLALLALAFVIGHGHQGIERFHAHEHGAASQCQDVAGKPCAAADESSAHGDDGAAGDHGSSAPASHGHCCTHPSATAIVLSLSPALAAPMSVCAWLQTPNATLPEAPVLGIDHPPQLARA